MNKRACYDDDRIDHHSRLLVVQTPAIRQVISSGRRLIQLNKNAHYGRCGLMVSGPAGPGRRPRLTQLGKTIEVITGAATRARPGTSPSSISPCRPRPSRR